jgi:hypothetical protein
MRRLIILTVMLTLLLTLVVSSPRATRVVKAFDQCEDCVRQVEANYELCEATIANEEVCANVYNSGVVACYATVCEQ